MFNIFKKEEIAESPAIAKWLNQPPPGTIDQRFRQKTVDDIGYLEESGKKELAKLEAAKLIAHLKAEFEL